MTTPEICWQPPDPGATALADFARFVAARTGGSYPDCDALWQYSTREVGPFWQAVADYFQIRWHDAPGPALAAGSGSGGVGPNAGHSDAGSAAVGPTADEPTADGFGPGTRWFSGSTLNYAEHALAGDGDAIAVIETDETGHERQVTKAELRAMVGAAQAGLRRFGVGKGDRVVALVPNRLEAIVAFLATAALGAVWSSCPPEFGATSVTDRFTQIDPAVLIAVDGYHYGGRDFEVTGVVSQLRATLPNLRGAVHIPALGTAAPEGAIDWTEFTATDAEPTFTPVEFNEPLWVLYSSGTTGLPKAIVQSVGGILLEHMKMLRLHQDLGPGKRFFWFTTTGWMMWNYLVGGLLVGTTIVTYDGNPGTPDLMTLWRLAAKHRIDCLGVSAAFLHACRSAGLTPGAEVDLSCVTAVGSTGSPLSPDGFDWVMSEIGPQVQINSLSGGTDLCTAIVAGASTVPVWRGEISTRALGAAVDSWDPAGHPVRDEVGELVITAPMPSMPIALWGDGDGSRMRAAYFDFFPGVWRHGDWIRITGRGSVVIEGRSDATLNRGGVRMGTAEFYRVVEDLPEVADSLVVDTSAGGTIGELVLFVVLADGAALDAATGAIKAAVRSGLSPRHVPDRVVAVPVIPRTLSGKKCEVPVKRILAGARVETVISRDALADPAGFDAFLAAVA